MAEAEDVGAVSRPFSSAQIRPPRWTAYIIYNVYILTLLPAIQFLIYEIPDSGFQIRMGS